MILKKGENRERERESERERYTERGRKERIERDEI